MNKYFKLIWNILFIFSFLYLLFLLSNLQQYSTDFYLLTLLLILNLFILLLFFFFQLYLSIWVYGLHLYGLLLLSYFVLYYLFYYYEYFNIWYCFLFLCLDLHQQLLFSLIFIFPFHFLPSLLLLLIFQFFIVILWCVYRVWHMLIVLDSRVVHFE